MEQKNERCGGVTREDLSDICKEKDIKLVRVPESYKYSIVFYRELNTILIFENATDDHIEKFIEGCFGGSLKRPCGPMTTEMIKTIKSHTTVGELFEAKDVYDALCDIEKEPLFAITLLYKLGVVRGKQIERARRKKGGVAR